MVKPLLGYITPKERTQEQHDADARAMTHMVAFTLAPPTVPKGTKVMLSDAWKAPEVVADVGFAFDRVHQLTGSCVGAGGGNALFSTIATQRLISDNPTRAFLPFWLGAYAMSRHYMGDDGQGEGSMGSTFAQALIRDGIRDWPSGGDGLPAWGDEDGVTVSGSNVEMKWSSYRNSDLQKVLDISRQHLLGSAAHLQSVADIKAAVLNGYGVSFCCNDYVGNGHLQGDGADAVVLGKYDGNGGHQQSVHGYWEHPSIGPLYLWLNNWPRSTYPILPTQPVCSVWMKESDAESAMRSLDADAYAFSHLSWFPSQVDRVLDWFI